MTDLSNYSVAELRSLQNQISEQLKMRAEQEKAAAREQILAIANRVGLPLKELVSGRLGTRSALKGRSVAIRFRNPDNTAQEWSGRGRKPKWVQEWMGTGKSIDALKVS
jgi:DNA-binding protein H-NS